MHEAEKSDLAIVAVKPANNSGPPDAEWVERRARAEGNVEQQRTRRAQNRGSVSQALDRIRESCEGHPWLEQSFRVKHPRWEPYAGNPPVRFCAGGAP
jgi:hypothetical protein